MPKDLKKAIRKVEDSLSAKSKEHIDKKALKEVEDWWVKGSAEDHIFPPGLGKAMVSTTQAIDIINGGLKVNALPEVVTTYINHRISIASNPKELQKQITHVVAPLAKQFNLALHAWGDDVDLSMVGCSHVGVESSKPSAGRIVLSEAFNSSLIPAPVSPHTIESPAWRLLSGAVKGVYATRPGSDANEVEKAKEIWMAPSMSTGVCSTTPE